VSVLDKMMHKPTFLWRLPKQREDNVHRQNLC
jgi:hypothetical protein